VISDPVLSDPVLFEPAAQSTTSVTDGHDTGDREDAPEAWIATEYARGPWDPRHCHGGPVSALLARACERAPAGDVDWLITRLTIELTRPVPVGVPLVLTTFVERPGRKVSVVAASLCDARTEVAKVRALRVRRRSFALPAHPLAAPDLTGTPGDGRHERVVWAADDSVVAFHSHGAEHRIVAGGWNEAGPVDLWIRLSVPLVRGETPSGVQRAAAAADFGNGVSSGLDYDRYLYINPDLTVHLAREPVGEWIGMSSHSVYGTPSESSGAGFAESALHDGLGRVGRSVQSLFVEPR
jgi:hypothetical protein